MYAFRSSSHALGMKSDQEMGLLVDFPIYVQFS